MNFPSLFFLSFIFNDNAPSFGDNNSLPPVRSRPSSPNLYIHYTLNTRFPPPPSHPKEKTRYHQKLYNFWENMKTFPHACIIYFYYFFGGGVFLADLTAHQHSTGHIGSQIYWKEQIRRRKGFKWNIASIAKLCIVGVTVNCRSLSDTFLTASECPLDIAEGDRHAKQGVQWSYSNLWNHTRSVYHA